MSERTERQSRRLGPAAVLDEQDIRALLGTFSMRAPSGIRNRALVLLLWRTGLRITEALSLELRDLQLDSAAPTLLVRNGKFGKQRVIGIHQEAQIALERWLEMRSTLGVGRQAPVFCTISANSCGGPMSASYVRSTLAAKARSAGLSARIHPHAFRATLAVELASEGVPLPAIRDVLGHANVAGTDAYLRRVFPQAAVSAVLDRQRPEPDPAEQRRELLDVLTSLDNVSVSRLLAAIKR